MWRRRGRRSAEPFSVRREHEMASQEPLPLTSVGRQSRAAFGHASALRPRFMGVSVYLDGLGVR